MSRWWQCGDINLVNILAVLLILFGAKCKGLKPKGSHLLNLYLTGYVGRPAAYRQDHPPRHLLAQQHRRGVRSQTKEHAPCKDLDMATKRLLSSRLLKINELKNAFAELQQQYENIQVENRTLRQVTFPFVFRNIHPSQLPPLLVFSPIIYVICTLVSSCSHYKDRIDALYLYPDTGSGTSAAAQ